MQIKVICGNATKVAAEVLVLKYAQANFGLDAHITSRLLKVGYAANELSPLPGECSIVPALRTGETEYVLFIGVEPLRQFRYHQIRIFGRHVLLKLNEVRPEARSLILTIHGMGYGLDEVESFEAQMAGLLDVIAAGNAPRELETITFVERNQGRAQRLAKVLDRLLPQGLIESPFSKLRQYGAEVELATNPYQYNTRTRSYNHQLERLQAQDYDAVVKPHIFVAMPFAEVFEDVFDYGIQTSVHGAGYLCERADQLSFTGDVMEWVKERIKTAAYVIADLTGANPNVYLEVGFAWGCGVPTILVVQDTEDLKFDLQGQRCLVYSRIKDLEKKLRHELDTLTS